MMSFVVDKQKMIVYPGVFLFIFSRFCLFELLGGSRNGPKWQKSCDPDIIWSSFMVDIWKRIISPSVFYVYAKFQFWGQWWVKMAKNGPKWQKILSFSMSQQLYLIWFWFLLHMCKMMISPESFHRNPEGVTCTPPITKFCWCFQETIYVYFMG